MDERWPHLVYERAREGEVENSCADISEIRDVPGFKLGIALEEGLHMS